MDKISDKVTAARLKDTSRSYHDVAELHSLVVSTQCPHQVSNSYTIRFPEYSPDKIFKVKVTMARS